MPETTYTFTRQQLGRLLHLTIEMYVEYLDKHGKDAADAQIYAASEMLEGLDATRELVANGELDAAHAGQVIAQGV